VDKTSAPGKQGIEQGYEAQEISSWYVRLADSRRQDSYFSPRYFVSTMENYELTDAPETPELN
jgi:hypothetical protein